MRVLFSRGDLAGAEAAIKRMKEIAGEHRVPPWMWSRMAAWQARLWLAQDKLDDASQWAEERELDIAADSPYLRQEEHIAWGRILVSEGRLEDAGRLLRRLLETAESQGHISAAIELLNLQALAFQCAGELDQAIAALERALSLGQTGGFVRAFVDEGAPMARLIYEAAAWGVAPEYTRRLLAAFPVATTAPPPSTKPGADSNAGWVEPLSERELEVLRLIGEGLTNGEIASRLFLSLNTVKAHTRNIYGKLGVHNRTQAVARGRALGALPPV